MIKRVRNSGEYNPYMLQLAREVRGLTRLELAEQTGIPFAEISRMEDEFLNIDSDTLQTLADHLRFPVAWFYQDGEKLPPLGWQSVCRGGSDEQLELF